MLCSITYIVTSKLTHITEYNTRFVAVSQYIQYTYQSSLCFSNFVTSDQTSTVLRY